MENMKTRLGNVYSALKDTFSYKNIMQSPRITKVVISVGTGKIEDKNRLILIQDRLAKITGQKTSPRPARLSIASFKLREGEIVGYQVTLRGPRMHNFLDKLVHIALPQTRDFRGLRTSSVDEMSNYTIGIKEHTIFPECVEDELKDVFGFAITIVTTASSKPEALALLRHIGLPLQKDEEITKKK